MNIVVKVLLNRGSSASYMIFFLFLGAGLFVYVGAIAS